MHAFPSPATSNVISGIFVVTRSSCTNNNNNNNDGFCCFSRCSVSQRTRCLVDTSRAAPTAVTTEESYLPNFVYLRSPTTAPQPPTRGLRGGERSRGSLITVWRNPRIRGYPPSGCCATIDHAVIRGCDGQCRGKQYFPIYLGLRSVKVESKSNKSRNLRTTLRASIRAEERSARIPAFVARHCRARRAREAR